MFDFFPFVLFLTAKNTVTNKDVQTQDNLQKKLAESKGKFNLILILMDDKFPTLRFTSFCIPKSHAGEGLIFHDFTDRMCCQVWMSADHTGEKRLLLAVLIFIGCIMNEVEYFLICFTTIYIFLRLVYLSPLCDFY